MKKIISFLLGLVLVTSFVSCSEPITTETKADGNKITYTETYEGGTTISTSFTIHKFEYEGHTYLYFMKTCGEQGYGGLTHDENCKCRKECRNE